MMNTEIMTCEVARPGEGSTVVDDEDVSGSVTSAMKDDEIPGYTIRGLINLGNTCYFNSVMQNLLAINKLHEYFFNLEEESCGCLSGAMRKFFVETCSEAVVNPTCLFSSVCTNASQFQGFQQHDSHELLRCLLDGLSTEELSDTKSSIDVIFGGQLCSSVSCLECGHSSTIYEQFLDLSLPVPTKKPKLLAPKKRSDLSPIQNPPPVQQQPDYLDPNPDEHVIGEQSDCFSWLDYLDPNPDEISPVQEIAIEDNVSLTVTPDNTKDLSSPVIAQDIEDVQNVKPEEVDGNICDSAESSTKDSGTDSKTSSEIVEDSKVMSEETASISSVVVDEDLNQSSDAKKGVIVDNCDAPLSVESCLGLFTKPEFLSKDEHAWQCDNCSKVLREENIKSRKLHMPVSDNGFEDRNPSPLSEDGKTCNTKGIANGNLEVGDSHLENTQLRTINSCFGLLECSTSSSNRHSGDSDSDKDCEPDKKEQVEVKVKRDANKSILISKLPSVLTIHLKRFSQDARGRLRKLNSHVNFTETIDLKPYIDPRFTEKDRSTYSLIGIVEHLGTMRGGHYVAYVRGNKDGVWYYVSDAYVRQASLEEVLHSEAYILFYERT